MGGCGYDSNSGMDVAAAGKGDHSEGETSASAGAVPERATLGSLLTCLRASVGVRQFALATWRGAANRDGFVLDIDR